MRLSLVRGKAALSAALCAAVLLPSFFILSACGPSEAAETPVPSDIPQETVSPPVTATPEPVSTDSPEVTPVAPEIGGSITLPPAAETVPVESFDPENMDGPKVPERATPADDEFFSDAAFLGNSLVDGFRLYSGLTTCDVYASTSLTVFGAGDLIASMAGQTYGKIYILLGINEIGYDAEYFKEAYRTMLGSIRAVQPEADIYIMSLTPVSRAKNDAGGSFTMERVNTYNAHLYDLADEEGCYYIDLVEALAGEDGFLPAEVTTDGIHFTADEYLVWLDYLRTHYV